MFLGQTTSPLDDVGLSSTIDRTASDYTDAGEKVKKIRELIRTGNYDADIAIYIPGVLKLVFQGMLEDANTKEKTANSSYKDMEELDFQILLPDNYYINPCGIHICFPMKIKNQQIRLLISMTTFNTSIPIYFNSTSFDRNLF